MKYKKNIPKYISLIVCLIPFIISSIFYKSLPKIVATHWDIDGNPNGYLPKVFAAYLVPTIILIGQIFFHFLPNNKKEEKYPPLVKSISIWLAPLLSIIIQSVIILKALKVNTSWEVFVFISVGSIFIIVGSFFINELDNDIVCIKFPWIIRNKENIYKLNRFTGYVWIFSGLLTIFSGLFKFNVIFLCSFITLFALPFIYSIIIYKKGKKQ